MRECGEALDWRCDYCDTCRPLRRQAAVRRAHAHFYEVHRDKIRARK